MTKLFEMGAAEKLKYSIEEYFELDKEGEPSGKRYEFHDGEVFIISDASIPHNQTVNSVANAFTNALKEKACQVLSSTQKINVQKRSFYCYPDIVVVCDKIETLDKHRDIITNPTLIVEVLSASTQDYDRGEKFRLYRSIPSLKEYICISSLEVSLEKYTRAENGFWILKEYNQLTDSILVESLGINLLLKQVYEKVDFEMDNNL